MGGRALPGLVKGVPRKTWLGVATGTQEPGQALCKVIQNASRLGQSALDQFGDQRVLFEDFKSQTPTPGKQERMFMAKTR